MFNKKLLAASMSAAISVGMVAQVSAIQLQENNIGQVLMGPMYIAADGLNTDIAVVNTRTDAAIKAKVIFREGKTSSEVLDFFIYLSPGDVWRGHVSGTASAAVLHSTDDSMVAANGNFASTDNPVNQTFFDKNDSGSNGFGHFEVVGVYSVNTGVYNSSVQDSNNDAINVKIGMSKTDLKKVTDAVDGEGGPGSDDATLDTGSRSNSDMPGRLQMFAEVQLTDGNGTGFVSYEVPALGPDNYANACSLDVDGTGLAAQYPNCVISNANFTATLAKDTKMGVGFSIDATDNIHPIEAAIATKDTVIEYNVENGNIVLPIVSFVTKYRHEGGTTTGSNGATLQPDDTTSSCSGGSNIATTGFDYAYGAPFQDTLIGEMIYAFTSWDNSENFNEATTDQFSGGTTTTSKIPDEVNLVPVSHYSTSGWSNIIYRGTNTCTYSTDALTAVPALTATLKTKGASILWAENGERRIGM